MKFSLGSKLYSHSKKLVMNAIEISSLSKKVKDSTQLIISLLSVEEGEIFGFLGPNGAGKSTTMMILTTLLKPTSGNASVYGHDVISNPSKVRKKIWICSTGNRN